MCKPCFSCFAVVRADCVTLFGSSSYKQAQKNISTSDPKIYKKIKRLPLTISDEEISNVTNIIENTRDLDSAHVQPSILLPSALDSERNIPSVEPTSQAKPMRLSVVYQQTVSGDESVLTGEP